MVHFFSGLESRGIFPIDFLHRDKKIYIYINKEFWFVLSSKIHLSLEKMNWIFTSKPYCYTLLKQEDVVGYIERTIIY